MELAQIGSMVDLINFFWERDANKDGKLESGEFQNIDKYDKSGNHVLVPWEVMEAVNLEKAAQIFSQKDIDSMLVRNADGKTFPCINLNENTIIQGMLFSSCGKDPDSCFAYIGGQPLDGSLGIREFIMLLGREIEYSDVCFNDNGQLLGGSLAVNTNIDGIIYKAGVLEGVKLPPIGFGPTLYPGIRFYENGQVESGMLVSDVTVDGIQYSSDPQHIDIFHEYPINFFKNGKVKSGRLSSDATVKDITYKAGTWIDFNENGGISVGTLSKDATIKGTSFEGGQI